MKCASGADESFCHENIYSKFKKKDLTNAKNCAIIAPTSQSKAVKGRVSGWMPFREPRLVERGTDRFAEHGPGAAQAIGSLRRVRPLTRRSMLVLPKAGIVRCL